MNDVDCSPGRFIRTVANGDATCALDADTTYAAGTGLALAGTTFSIPAGVLAASMLGTDLATAGAVNAAANRLQWSRLAGVPAGFADGVDDAGLALTRTFLVSPQATPELSGAHLRAVLDGIIADATSRALVLVEPGVYELGFDSLFMRTYVDVQGSGEGATEIRGDGANGQGVVVMGGGSEMRGLTVRSYFDTAISFLGGNGRLREVTAVSDIPASSGQGHGVRVRAGDATLERVKIIVTSAPGSSYAWGLTVEGGTVTANGLDILVRGPTQFHHEGMFVRGSSGHASVDATDLTIRVGGASQEGRGVFVYSDAHVNLTRAQIEVLDAQSVYGFLTGQDRVRHTLRDARIEVVGIVNAVGVHSTGGPVTIEQSEIRAQKPLGDPWGAPVVARHSTLLGGAVSGIPICVATVDEANAFYANGCPP